MGDFFDKAFVERRSLEQVLSDLRARYQCRPGPELARKIQNIEAEISHRDAAHQPAERDRTDLGSARSAANPQAKS